MKAVNLLPRELIEGRKRPPAPVLAACGGGVLIAAVLAVMFLSASQKVASEQKTLSDLVATYNSIPAPAPPSPLVAQVPQEKQARVSALAIVLGQRVVWDRLLREVSEVVPSDVWLTTVDAQSPTYGTGNATTPPPATSGSPQGFVVEGCTYSQASVARFLARLQLVPDLTGMTLARSQKQGAATDGPAGGASGGGGSSGGGGGSCPDGMVSFSVNGNIQLGASS
jgi:Tfp pilus assembly protein PilN